MFGFGIGVWGLLGASWVVVVAGVKLIQGNYSHSLFLP